MDPEKFEAVYQASWKPMMCKDFVVALFYRAESQEN